MCEINNLNKHLIYEQKSEMYGHQGKPQTLTPNVLLGGKGGIKAMHCEMTTQYRTWIAIGPFIRQYRERAVRDQQ